jgi:hypothetical protein
MLIQEEAQEALTVPPGSENTNINNIKIHNLIAYCLDLRSIGKYQRYNMKRKGLS